MKIKPIGKRILVKLAKEEEKIVGGIIIPGMSNKENSNFGTVIAVGNHSDLEEIKIGQEIIYSKNSGTEIKDGEDKYLILDIEDILAIVE